MTWGALSDIMTPLVAEQSDSESTSAAVVSGIAALLERLPALHKRVVFQLCEFLSRVDPVASKMTPENLAIVFAPCILRHADLHVRAIAISDLATSPRLCFAWLAGGLG